MGLRHDLSPPPLRRDSRHRRNAARGRGCVPTQLPCATAGGRGPPTAGCWPQAERTPPPPFVLSLGDPRRGVETPPSGGAQTGKSDYAATAPQCCPPVPRSGGPTAGFHRWPWSGKVVSFPSVDSGTCGSPGQRWTKVVPVRADRQRQGPLQGVCGPGRAVSRALNHQAELLVLPSPPQGDRSRRVQRPRRSHGAAVSLSARHASGPGPRSDVTPRAAKRSGQLRPGDKAPPIRRPNAASAHGFSQFRGFARCGRCFAVPRLQPDGPGQPGSHARRLVSRQPRWQPRALVSQPRSFPGGGAGVGSPQPLLASRSRMPRWSEHVARLKPAYVWRWPIRDLAMGREGISVTVS